MSAFSEVAAAEPHEIWNGVLGRVVAGEQATLAVIELEPDAVVPEHRHPNEQLGILVSGSLAFTIGGETRELGPGCTWCIPGEVPHDVRAGSEGAVLVEAFAPARGDWASLVHREPSPPLWP